MLPRAQSSTHIMADAQWMCVGLDQPPMQLPSCWVQRGKFTRWYLAKNWPLKESHVSLFVTLPSQSWKSIERIIRMTLFNNLKCMPKFREQSFGQSNICRKISKKVHLWYKMYIVLDFHTNTYKSIFKMGNAYKKCGTHFMQMVSSKYHDYSKYIKYIKYIIHNYDVTS